MLRRAIVAIALVALPLLRAGAQIVVTGVVIDSVTGRPLAGALVQFVRDSARTQVLSATTDSAGVYRIEGVRPDTYLAGFFHFAIDAIGIDLAPRSLAIGMSSPQRVDFAIPSAKTIVRALCPADSRTDSLALMVGHLRDAETGLPRIGTVTLVWWEFVIAQGSIKHDRRIIPAKTTSDGWFAMCGLPAAIDITAIAQSGSAESGVVEVRLPAGGLLVRDFRVSEADSTIAIYADTAASDSSRVRVATLRRGAARLSGVARTAKGKPVANASVSLPGSGLEARTLEDGTFSLTQLPTGTQTVEVRAIGFEPKRVAVELFRDRLTTVDVLLDTPVHTLDVVKVFGKGRSGLAEFDRRRRAGWGRILTMADIEKRHALRVSDLFRTMPGVRVVPTGAFGSVVLLRGGCRPTVYLNGMRLPDDAGNDLDQLASPSELTAVEVYNTAGRPAEFCGNNCGSVVLWAGTMPR
jgi:hypothetical protein